MVANKPEILIIDYEVGNLSSVSRSIEAVGGVPIITKDPSKIKDYNYIVLPGVGSFSDAMKQLKVSGWLEVLRSPIFVGEKYLLGICLGMQLLADYGDEGGGAEGIGLLPGRVELLHPKKSERIPHVGWNEVIPTKKSPLFNEPKQINDFYFVHSYHFIPAEKDIVLATTPYCEQFVSAIGNNNIFGMQFHPEKSSSAGLNLLKNFIEL